VASGRIDPATRILPTPERDPVVGDRIDRATETGLTDQATTMTIDRGRIDRVVATDRVAETDQVAAIDQTDRAAATGRIDREMETGQTDQAAAMTIDPGGIDRASDRRTDRISAIGLAAETVLGSIDRAPATGRPSTFSDRPSGHPWDGCGRRCGRLGTAGGIAVTGAAFSTATTKRGCAEAGTGAIDPGSGRWGLLARAGCCRRR